VKRVIALVAFVLLAGCTSSDKEISQDCADKGLTPGTAAFEQSRTASTLNQDFTIQHETARQMMMGK
jgi:hypothetical protein